MITIDDLYKDITKDKMRIMKRDIDKIEKIMPPEHKMIKMTKELIKRWDEEHKE